MLVRNLESACSREGENWFTRGAARIQVANVCRPTRPQMKTGQPLAGKLPAKDWPLDAAAGRYAGGGPRGSIVIVVVTGS